ncbi:hypothetical protein A0H81_03434 [Grifola frondosa]|uniref:DUF6534 domain-containing protein n=1 Tax=Grifola frondosa TaxID=5627 RepID=A0A1C7MJ65_GRIFR|nr:hypothetical protein A0H81_03434 [Grifola frondosa]
MSSPIKLDNTLGAAFLGNIVAAIFYGITSVQTFSYYKRNGNDPRFMKIMIFILWILDGLHLALITDTLYTYTVKDFTDVLAISVPTRTHFQQYSVFSATEFGDSAKGVGFWELPLGCLFCPCLVGAEPLSIICILTIGDASEGTNLAVSGKCFNMSTYLQLANFAWLPYLGLSGAIAADFIIAVSLCWLLAKRRTGFKRTDSIIRVLMLYSINTCVLTTLCGFCCLITLIMMPDNLIFMAFYFAMPKLFINSFLAMLNSRKHMREMGSSSPITSIPLSALSGTRISASADGVGGKSQPQYENQVLQIQIQTTTDIKSDSATPIV